jgi:2-keto-4-pentenoate hydratase
VRWFIRSEKPRVTDTGKSDGVSTMSLNTIELAAHALAGAIRDDTALTGWPDGVGPTTIDDAYRIQERTHAILARKNAGWKVGWTTSKLQEANGVGAPMAGRVPSATVVSSGAAVREVRPANLRCEAELAFRLAVALPARVAEYSERDLMSAIGLVYPAIEIVGCRFLDPRVAGIFGVVADNGAHAGLVLGTPIEDWQAIDRISLTSRLHVDDVEIAHGKGSNVLGDPLKPCIWLANWLSRQGKGLEAGDVISSGSFLGAPPVPIASDVVADFGTCGRVVVRFSGP